MEEKVMRTLRENVTDWTDVDETGHALALALGILDAAVPGKLTKHVFWTSNQLIDALQDILDILVRIGALDWNQEEQQYRWNPTFTWDSVSARPGRSQA
jgi:hypothetical protein